MHSHQFHALLSTARIANVPSVLSNVWLGLALGSVAGTGKAGDWMSHQFWALSVAGVLLYVSGNFLNDWMDRSWDEQHRPERALPRRIFTPELYLRAALFLMAAGVSVAGAINWQAGGIAVLIVSCIGIYTIWHKRAALAVIPMGFCRALLPMMGALGTLQNGASIACCATVAGVGAISLFCYIVGLSLSARNESLPNPPASAKLFSLCLFAVPPILVMTPFAISQEISLHWLFGVVPYLVWIALCLSILGNRFPNTFQCSWQGFH
ncbi:MAG: UbiA family prenyltransferase [Akkermansiaceae bacterium]|nr:UbiA family prenyltransferase [Akkermansiaceae bacterium]